MLDLVGERALTTVLTPRLLGVAAVDFASTALTGFGGIVLGMNNGTGGIPPSCEFGRELYPMDEAGRERGAIGLSGVKKLDFRLRTAGDGGI